MVRRNLIGDLKRRRTASIQRNIFYYRKNYLHPTWGKRTVEEETFSNCFRRLEKKAFSIDVGRRVKERELLKEKGRP